MTYEYSPTRSNVSASWLSSAASVAEGSRPLAPSEPGPGRESPTEVQLMSRSAARGSGTGCTPSSRARASARSGVRFHTFTSRAPASRRAKAAARALPPAPRICALIPRGERPSAASRPGASVFSAATEPSSPNVSVLAAPISSALALALSASASAASLWGIVTLAPRKPAAGSARTVSSKSSGGTGSSW